MSSRRRVGPARPSRRVVASIGAWLILVGVTMIGPLDLAGPNGDGSVTGRSVAARSVRSGAGLSGQRVLAIGDSLMDDTSTSLARRLRSAGATALVEGHRGSGLATDLWLGDWLVRARELVDQFHPTVVVVEFCCNYWTPYPSGVEGRAARPGTRAMRDLWEAQARRLATILTRDGAELWWVMTPPAADATTTSTLVDDINETTVAMVERPTKGERAPKLVRWDLALTDGTGRYHDRIAGPNGPVPARRGGLHFTAAGAEAAATATVEALSGAQPARPWGAFPSMVTVTELAMVNALGLDGTDDATRWRLSERFRTQPTTVEQHLAEILHSPAWGGSAAPVIRIYQATTGRPPDLAGLRYWTRAVATGRETIASMAKRFVAGPDFALVYGRLDDRAFLAALSEELLGRPLDAAGTAFWLPRLAQGVARSDVVVAWAGSPEYQAQTAARVEAIIAWAGIVRQLPDPMPAIGTPLVDPMQPLADVLASNALRTALSRFQP